MLDFHTVLARLFAGDKVLPSQVTPARQPSGELRLYIAIFEDAISVIQKGEELGRNPKSDYHIRRLAYQAISWVLEERDTWPCSFARHCLILGLDEGKTRKGMIALYRHYFGEEIVKPRQTPGLQGGRRSSKHKNISYRRIWHEHSEDEPSRPIRAQIIVEQDTIDLGRFASQGMAKSACGWRYHREMVARQKKHAA